MTGLVLAVLCAGARAAVPASKPRPRQTLKTSGRVLTISTGRLTIADDAGHTEEFAFDVRTKATCDGKKYPLLKAGSPGPCSRAAKLLYDPVTKKISTLELKSAAQADADDAPGRANAAGEVASTDVIGGLISVRLGGGAMLAFKVGGATKIAYEAAGQPPLEKPFEAIKVGDRVEIRSKDWKTADEIHFRSAER